MFRYRNALRLPLLALFLAWILMNMPVSPAVSAPLPPEAGAPEELVRLPGHVLPALKGATPMAPTPGTDAEPLTLTVVLKRTDQAGFDRYLHDVYNPASPSFRHFLSQGEITERFGPTPEAYEGVLAYLQQHGFTLVHGSTNHLTLTVRGTRAQAERAFGVYIADFEAGGRRFFANTEDPAVPLHLGTHVQAVLGLADLRRPQAAMSLVQVLYANLVETATVLRLTAGGAAGIVAAAVEDPVVAALVARAGGAEALLAAIQSAIAMLSVDR